MKTIAYLMASLTLAGTTLGTTARAEKHEGDDKGDGKDRVAIYVADNPGGPNGVEVFLKDPHTGLLTRKGRYLTGGQGDAGILGFQSHALVSDGEYLYVVNSGSDEISAFAIQHDGALRLLGKVPSQGRRPVSLALHDDLLYVANEGNIPVVPPFLQLPGSYTGFHIKDNGTLQPVPGSTVALAVGESPAEIFFNREGTRLLGSRLGTGILDSFGIGPSGALVDAAPLSGQGGVFGGVPSPIHDDLFFMTLAGAPFGTPGVASYRLHAGTSPTLVDLEQDPVQVDPCWATMSPDGKRLWSSSPIPRALTLYTVDAGGQLHQASGISATDGLGSFDLAMDPAGQYLYRLRVFDVPSMGGVPTIPQLEVYQVTASTANAGVQLLQSITLPADLLGASTTGVIAVGL